MEPHKLRIGQKKVQPRDFVDNALKAIGHNSGRTSPLVAMAVDPAHRAKVQAMLYDGAWQMTHCHDEVISAKWHQFAKTCAMVLAYTKRVHNANARRLAQ